MRGIVGKNHSCFMGSVISALAYIPCFSQTLTSHEAFQSLDSDNQPLLASMINYFHELLEQINENQSTKSKPIINSKILNKHNAVETNYLYNNKINIMGTYIIEGKILSDDYDPIDFFVKLLDIICLESSHCMSLVNSVFGYNLTHEQYCTNGHTTIGNSNDHKLVVEIGVDFSSKRRYSMKHLIKNHFFNMKQNQINDLCPDCSENGSGSRRTIDRYKYEMQSFPEVLIVRFSPIKNSYIRNDMEIKIAIIVEVATTIYKLCSFIIHLPGHYISYVQGLDLNWYKIDDSVVEQIKITELIKIKTTCAICFYQKTNAPYSDAQLYDITNLIGYSTRNNKIAVSMPLTLNPISEKDLFVIYELYNKFHDEDDVNIEMVKDLTDFRKMRKIPNNIEKMPEIFFNICSRFEVIEGKIPENYCSLYFTSNGNNAKSFLENKKSYAYSYQTGLRIFQDPSRKHVLVVEVDKK